MQITSPEGYVRALPDSESRLPSGGFPVVAVALICLLAVEMACFYPAVFQIGFYLDDWATLSFLHFGPQAFFERLAHYFLQDSRVVIRPVEAPFFALLYGAFTNHPLGYHLVNGALEVLSAWLLFALVKDFSGNRMLSFVAALSLLLYPIHDVTHYWMLASSVTLSLVFSLSSMWLTVKGVAGGKRHYHAFSYLFFALGIFNYESFLPLCMVNGLLAFLLMRKRLPAPRALINASLLTLPYFFCIASLWGWQRIIVPAMGVKALLHPVRFDTGWMLHTILQGLKLSLPFGNFSFFQREIQTMLAQGVHARVWVTLALACLFSAIGAGAAAAGSRDRFRGSLELLLTGVFLSVMSYTIFGLNPEYEPTLDTIINRVNYGSAVGMSLVFAGLTGVILKALSHCGLGSRAQVACLVTLVIPFTGLCVLANQAMSQPWIVSWITQKNISALIKKEAANLHDNDSVILVNCPRYISWSPVFDGVWDFQSMVRLTLNNERVNAGAVSERMVVSGEDVRDISAGYTCGVYPWRSLFLLIPQDGGIKKVNSAGAFIEAIESKGLGFGLNPSVIGQWRQQVSVAGKR